MSSSATPSAITNNNLKTQNMVERRRNPPEKMEKGQQFGAIKHINTSYFLKGEDFLLMLLPLFAQKGKTSNSKILVFKMDKVVFLRESEIT